MLVWLVGLCVCDNVACAFLVLILYIFFMIKNFFTSIASAWGNLSLVVRICIGMVLGAIAGLLIPQAVWISVIGDLFVWALKAIAPILVFVLVVSALSTAKGGLGGRFRTLILRYLLTTILAALLAVCASQIFPITLQLKGLADAQPSGSIGDLFKGILLSIVTNPVKAIAEANYLSILFWSLLMGVSMRALASDATKKVLSDISDGVTKIVKMIISCAPFGIFGLVFAGVSESGLEIFTTYGRLLLLLVGCMVGSTLVVNPILAGVIMKGNPYPLVWKCLKESGVHAFFTRSSAANIPFNMRLCESMGVDKDFYSVAVPLGSTINMDGAAITITVMTMATCHTLGIEVGFIQSMILSLLASVAACGASGVAGGSLLLIPMACSLFGISNDIAMQVVAVGFIIGVIQDSVETALNSSCDVLFIIATDIRDKKLKLNKQE